MIGLVLLAALLAALAASGYRTRRRFRRRRALAALPGGSRATAIPVEAFTEIDDHLARRECLCGGLLMNLGERSEHEAAERSERAEAKRKAAPADTRILRVMRVECRRCEDRSEVWFDATRAYH